MAAKPPDVQFGLHTTSDGNILFAIDKVWFDLLFTSANDAIAIDIIDREQYDCHAPPFSMRDGFHKGQLMPPMFAKDMRSNMRVTDNGLAVVNYGKKDPIYANKNTELNLVMVQNRYACYYNNFYDIKKYKWQLLDMGIFMDTLISLGNRDSIGTFQQITTHTNYLGKHLKFTIPFDKNAVKFDAAALRPMHDSLHFTDYYVRKIAIRAYASVEGLEAKNSEIQKQRAESMAWALQSYQRPEIKIEITVAENWVEFLDDISKTAFKGWEMLTKAEIKEKLKDKKAADQLEPFLKNHRKAVLYIELEKIVDFKNVSDENIVGLFNKAVADKKTTKAKEIQNTIFERIIARELAIKVLNNLEIPKQADFCTLLNNNAIFRYVFENDYVTALEELSVLRGFFPNDPKIFYNLCVLKFRQWASEPLLVDKEKFLSEIYSLKNCGIDPKIIGKMLLNYHIMLCEIYTKEKKFDKKQVALKFIQQHYKEAKLHDQDLLNLAQYFVSYSKTEFATALIAPYMKGIDINEDLLFYYLNLTIVNNDAVKASGYKKILLNAVNVNRSRFCQLFGTYGQGGITFQLLENPSLKKMYCENCQQ